MKYPYHGRQCQKAPEHKNSLGQPSQKSTDRNRVGCLEQVSRVWKDRVVSKACYLADFDDPARRHVLFGHVVLFHGGFGNRPLGMPSTRLDGYANAAGLKGAVRLTDGLLFIDRVVK